MKIAIIGSGTSAIITALVCLSNGHQVEIYYDPNTSPLNVGESTTSAIGRIIADTLKICIGDLYDNDIVSYKNGVKFINWGNSDHFRHHFQDNSSAFHFETSIFNPFMHKQMENAGVVYHAQKVTQYSIDLENDCVILNENTYDFVIHCSGWANTSDYFESNFETVNSAILYTENSIDEPSYTIHRATEHGWEFGLPFPNKNITKHGYLFNNKFEDPKDIQKLLNKENSKVIDWKPKYGKKMLRSKYEAYNGNRLLFFEPLQALSLHYYHEFARNINLFLQERTLENFGLQNLFYRQKIFEYETTIAFHYSYGSKYDSIFWKDAYERSNKLLNMHSAYQKESMNELYFIDNISKINNLKLGIFQEWDYKILHSGMSGIPMNQICNNINIPGFIN
jgi:hypothetical protein